MRSWDFSRKKEEKNDRKKYRKTLIIGIVGCLLYVVGDYLYAATGKGQTTETIGFMVKVAYLDVAT